MIRVVLGTLPVVGQIAQGCEEIYRRRSLCNMSEATIQDIDEKIHAVQAFQEKEALWYGGSALQLLVTFVAARILQWSTLGVVGLALGVGTFAVNSLFMWRWNAQWINRFQERLMGCYRDGVLARYQTWQVNNHKQLESDPCNLTPEELNALDPSNVLQGFDVVERIVRRDFAKKTLGSSSNATDPRMEVLDKIARARLYVVSAITSMMNCQKHQNAPTAETEKSLPRYSRNHPDARLRGQPIPREQLAQGVRSTIAAFRQAIRDFAAHRFVF